MTAVPAKARLLTILVILSNVLGNLLLSVGLRTQVEAAGSGLWSLIRPLLSPPVILGVSLLIFWMLSRMALLSWADLSYVLPVTSIGYVLTAIAGRVVLHEEISGIRWAGTLFIVAGTALVGLTPPKTSGQPE